MHITLTPALLEEKPILEHLMQLYLYDFTEFDGDDVNDQGVYLNKYLPLYWAEPGRRPFLIRAERNLAGLVLVRLNIDGLIDPSHKVNQIAEFFVMKKYRRYGVGQFAARCVFDQFPGNWEIEQIVSNFPALIFWRKTIGLYTNENYQEVFFDNQHHHGPIQTFSNQFSVSSVQSND
jgi:predicted acetyltransferase